MEKQNWILLRGLCRGVGHWGDFVDLFKVRYPQHSVELIDIPGNGYRNLETSPQEISQYVDEIRQKSQFLQEGRTVRILALSLGGMIAMDWAHRYPDEVEKIVLMSSSSGGLSQPWERFQLSNFPRFAKIMTSQSAEAFERSVLEMISNNHDRAEAVLPALTEHTLEYPVQYLNFAKQIWAASRFKAPESARAEVVILGSWGDRMVSPQCSLALAKHFGIEARMHPWAGHDIPIDDPQWILDQLV